MPVLAPRVVAPLTVCSSHVVLFGVIPGADVQIFAQSTDLLTLVAEGVATSTRQTFAVNRVGSLPAASDVYAVQGFAGETSVPDSDRVRVGGASIVGPPEWSTHLHECGSCVQIAGLIPGAIVRIVGNDGVLTEAPVHETVAGLGLRRPIRPGETPTVLQTACGREGPERRAQMTTLPYGNAPLPPPTILQPSVQCGRRLYVGDVFPGAIVRVQRSVGLELAACFHVHELYFPLSESQMLVEGESLVVSQAFPDCGLESGPGTPVFVRPASERTAPRIEGTLCAGQRRLVVSGLEPEAIVRVSRTDAAGAGEEFGIGGVSERTQVFPTPPLREGDAIQVEQTFCGVALISAAVVVGPVGNVSNPTLPRLYECTTTVPVDDVMPHALIDVASDRLGLIGRTVASGTSVFVPVTALRAGDGITVIQTACGRSTYAFRPVESLPSLAEPSLVFPFFPGDRIVGATGALPGAIVEVYVNGAYRGEAVAGAAAAEVPLIGVLALGDTIQLRQRLCAGVSTLSAPSPGVAACRGTIRLGLITLNSGRPESLRLGALAARTLFGQYGFRVVIVGERMVSRPELDDIDIGDCRRGTTTADLDALHDIRLDFGDEDIRVYLVRSLNPSEAGCSSPGTRPACVLDSTALVEASFGSRWNLAHEVAHVLGLDHAGGASRLMNDVGTYSDPPPDLIESEVSMIERSPWLNPC